MSAVSSVALLGFGEVGQIFAADLCAAGLRVSAWDTAFADPNSGPSMALERFSTVHSLDYPPFSVSRSELVRRATSAEDAVRGAQLVISAVTAANDVAAACAAAAGLMPGTFFLDVNSSSPSTKQMAAWCVAWAEARYVEAAVMSPIQPKRIASPMLLGGVYALPFLDAVADLGFDGAQFYSPDVGRAAATKLCRSVIVKGVEALLTEALLAARHYRVEEDVLASLSNLLPLPDWNTTAQYMIARALEHGVRRAEEMREAARAVEEARIQPLMSQAIAERQDWAAAHRSAISPDLVAMLDAINATLENRS